MSDAARLWAKTHHGHPDVCWPYAGPLEAYGYGKFYLRGRHARAHRAAYELWIGPVPDGCCVLHTCDNTTCINPAHLWASTQADNVRDAQRKRRLRGNVCARGEANPHARLTEDAVRAIRKRLATGALLREIAAEYGICIALVGHIKTGRLWAHVKET